MEITHEVLLSLGLLEVPNRPTRYSYKGWTGRLNPETGQFFFHGFSPAINTLSDLRYLMMLIDYNWESTMAPYPNNYN